jgi:hypothetical protein
LTAVEVERLNGNLPPIRSDPLPRNPTSHRQLLRAALHVSGLIPGKT